MNNQKTLIVLIVILVGLITFLGGYLVAQKKNLPQQANISNLNRFSISMTSQKAGTKTMSGLGRLSNVKALNPYLSEDGKKIIYSEKGTGKFFSTDFSGQSNNVIQGSPLYDLDPNISGVAFSKNRQKIAYLFFDKNSEEGQISIANPDGTVFKNILPTRAKQLKLDWANANKISFYNSTGEDHSLFLLDIETKQIEKILDSLNGLKILWSPDGSKLLYSGNNQLSLLDLQTNSSLTIDLQTEADRCVWTLNSLFVYCGALNNNLSDNLYHLDVGKKEFGLVFQPSLADKIKIKKPLLSPAEDLLFFVNDIDGYLYRINLD